MSSQEHDAWFSREIEKLGPTLFRVAFAILRNRTDCEDAAQNAVLKAYRNLGSLKQRGYFKTWLISILKNECFDMLKRRRPTLDVTEQELSYEMAVPDVDLNRAFDQLSPEERLTITLYYASPSPSTITKATTPARSPSSPRSARGRCGAVSPGAAPAFGPCCRKRRQPNEEKRV